MADRPRILISALRGGSGKTMLTLGLLTAWRESGFEVAAFKKGPDYIDAGWLSRAAGRPCRNLDPFLMEPEVIVDSFTAHSAGVDVSVIEGNRGLYDGVNVEGIFSSAELAKLLRAPVVLVVDCTKMTRTVGALVKGCVEFDPDLEIGGVVLNQTAGARHRRLTRSVIETYTDLPVLGEVPRLPKDAFPERHMGLIPPQEHGRAMDSITCALKLAQEHLDLERLWEVARSAPAWEVDLPAGTVVKGDGAHRVRIGVIRDSAFQFYYPENIESLERAGAEIIEISALSDPTLPGLDGLYIGGGFPETHGAHLAQNRSFLESVRAAAEGGLPIWAECGGLIFLGRELVVEGQAYAMAGVLDLRLVLERRPRAHGYTIIAVDGDNPYFETGKTISAHEFHYCRVDEVNLDSARLVFSVSRGEGIAYGRDGMVKGNVLATFSHIHSLAVPDWAESFVSVCLKRALD